MTPDYAAVLKDVGRGRHGVRDLDRRLARSLFDAMLAGAVPDLELGALLVAFRCKGESAAEMLGFLDAVDAGTARLEPAPDGPRPVILPTYSGACRQPNLTPLLALMLARFGVPVLLHGPGDETPGAFGRVTTLAVLRALGHAPAASLGAASEQLARERLAYVPLSLLVPGLAALVARRARLGLRSSAHALAKLVDPFGGASLRVVAVTHPDDLVRMRDVLVASHASALLMRGTEGEPYANPRRQPAIERIEGGIVTVAVEAEPQDTSEPALPADCDAGTTAAWTAAALEGSVPVPLPIVNQIGCCLE